MKRSALAVASAALSLSSLIAADTASQNWPAWRGPTGNGVSSTANPPITWSETQNVKWKVAIPGRGSSTPVIWNDQVFILTAVPAGKTSPAPAAGADAPPGGGRRGGGSEAPTDEQKFTLIAYDRATGKVRWEHNPRTQVPHEGHHRDHGFASASPVTDGEVLIAYFGSFGIYGYDMKGKLLWEKDLGDMRTRNSFGEGSSPALHGNTVVVLWDHEGDDFIVALDKRTGNEIWRQKRDEPTGWSTPLIVTHEGKPQVVVNGTNRVRAYDLATGALLWEAGGQTVNSIPSPVHGHGRVYVMSGFRGSAAQAITLGRTGDLTGTDAVAWSHNKGTPYVPSPLLYGDLLWFFGANNAILTVVDAPSGKIQLDGERLDGLLGVYASPTGAANRVYLLGRDGGALVVKNEPKLEILAKNRLDDGFDASPAVVGNELFLRGREFLYCIAEAK